MRKQDKLKSIEEANKRLLQEGSGPGGRVSFDVMIHKLTMGKELGEPDLSMMVDEVITDLKTYLDYDVIKKDNKGMSDTDRLNWFGGR